ncbi:PHP domain-containing protein [Kitasatospora sp. DSM 101779]|uniref:PHP domain-containing protein n=1 Tax=Kitasatospora sp. DSM 101779 TaxID=2853165 RepID=UPI0021D90E71|nr:PHP domain-containing protein [Kitasatospora sp. DSM 101779]
MFTRLHVASGYSARYGASLPAALAARAADQKLGALAVTDRDTVASAVRFAKASAASGGRPLFGADLAVPLLDTAAAGRTGRPGGAAAAGERRPRTLHGVGRSSTSPRRGSPCWRGTRPGGRTCAL